MTDIVGLNTDYKQWLKDLKLRIKQSQLKATIAVNAELLSLYWSLGKDIVEKQANTSWGDRLIEQLSKDLKKEFPQIKGFSERNLWYIKQWYLFYNQHNTILQQAVAELATNENIGQLVSQIPWGHNLRIISKCKSVDEALFYIQKTIEFGWSRDMLDQHIKLQEYQRMGRSVTNFSRMLPMVQSDLAQQTLKDPYLFDFLSLTDGYKERELENALTDNITKFLIELGSGFAYVGRQVHIKVGDTDFYMDLLFYHLKLRCYVVVELKVVEFVPEFAGKLNFYITAVDRQLKQENDNPTIGILICKSKNDIVVEYALDNINKPIGVSSYELTKLFPEDFKGSLPTIEEIEEELKEGLKDS